MASFQVNATPESLSYAATMLVGSYLSYRCFTPPNPPNTREKPKSDSLATDSTMAFLRIYTLWTFSSGVLQAFYSVVKPTEPSLLCPAPGNMNHSLLEWNQFTAPLAALTLTFGFMRVVAYAQLGGNFTYELARPSGLFTGGLYHYLQHPSYTAAAFFSIGFLPLMGRFDAGYACFVPSNLMTGLNIAHWIFMFYTIFIRLPLRVVEEEAWLKGIFGKEWEEYHRQTCRFLPGLF